MPFDPLSPDYLDQFLPGNVAQDNGFSSSAKTGFLEALMKRQNPGQVEPVIDPSQTNPEDQYAMPEQQPVAIGVPKMGGVSSAYEDLKNANNAIAQADKDANAATIEILKERKRAAEELDNEERFNQIEQDKVIGDTMKKIDQANDDYANYKIDPNRFRRNMATEDKWKFFGSMLLSGLADAALVYSGRNPQYANKAMEFMDKEIDRDIEAQHAELQKKGNSINALNSQLGRNLQIFGDRRQALMATRIQKYQDFQDMISDMALQYNNPRIDAKAKQLNAGIDLQKQQATEALKNQAVENFQRRASGIASLADAEYKSSGAGNKGGTLKPMAAESAGKFALALTAMRDLDRQHPNLNSVDWNVLGNSEKKQLRTLMEQVVLRISTGAGYKDDEKADAIKMMVPIPMDSKQEYQKKVQRFREFAESSLTAMDPSGSVRGIVDRNLGATGSQVSNQFPSAKMVGVVNR